MTAPGYYADPWAEGGLRWWDGTAWTEHVATPAPAVVEPVVAQPGVFLPGDDVLPAAPAAPQVAPAPAFQPVVAPPAAAWAPAFAPAVARAAAPATYGFGVPADHGRSALPSWGYGAPGYVPAARRDDRPAWLVPTAIVSAVLLLVVLVGSWSSSHRQVPAPQGDPAASDPAGVAQPGTVVGGDGGSSTSGGASGGDSIESSATLVAGPAVDTNPAVARRRTGPAVPPVTTPHGADLVTPADARAVVAAFWPQHERVVVARDLRGISALSTGAARLYEVGGLACGCWEQLSERRLVAATYFVRHQTRYPVDFLVNTESAVIGRTLPSPWTDLFVFTKAAAGKPWLMTLHSGMAYTGATSPPMFEPYTDAQGYLREYRPSDAAALHARALLLAQETASLWQTSKDTGRIPDHPTLSVTGVDEQRLLDLAAHRQGQRQVNGALGTYRFWVAPSDPLFEYEGAGWEVACRAVRETVRFTPPTGLVLVQGTAYRPWGYPVPAGRYLSATTTGAWQTCWVNSVMPNTPASPLLNSSDMGGSTVATP